MKKGEMMKNVDKLNMRVPVKRKGKANIFKCSTYFNEIRFFFLNG